MKQGVRFLLKPKSFINQMQWSSNHWFFLLTFLVLATVETQVGRQNQLLASFAGVLQSRFGWNLDFALWVIMAAKLVVMLGGAFAIASVIYFVGSLLGRRNSRRVFYRRLAVVFTVFLSAFTVQHFGVVHPWLGFVSWGLYAWAALLGFMAIQEQFELNIVETLLVSAFAALMVTTTWHFSNNFFESKVREQTNLLSNRSGETVAPRAGQGL